MNTATQLLKEALGCVRLVQEDWSQHLQRNNGDAHAEAAIRHVALLREDIEAYLAKQQDCNQHPDAPHGFSRNASHNAGRYVCECEGWMPEQQVERQQTQRFHFENESDSENELNAIITEKGHLRIGVAQEKAINSYNETFECEVRIPIDAAEKLRDFLLQNFPDSKQVEQEPVKFEYFKDWMVKEMPPLTTIGNPEWWAKRIYDRFIYTTPQAREQQVEQEPVAWLVTTELQDGTRSTYPLTGRYKDVRDSCDFGEPIPLYTKYNGALIVHKGCKATWANGVIEVMPVVQEPAPLGAPMFWHAPPGAFMPAKQTNLSK